MEPNLFKSTIQRSNNLKETLGMQIFEGMEEFHCIIPKHTELFNLIGRKNLDDTKICALLYIIVRVLLRLLQFYAIAFLKYTNIVRFYQFQIIYPPIM